MMNINKKLIPLKLHFFLASAGIAPIAPFIPVYAKQLGFTSISFGWTQTIYPIALTVIKPFAGAIIDNVKSKKFILLTLLMLCGVFGFSLKWIKPLPMSNTAQTKCNDSLLVVVCSELLKESFYVDKLKNTLKSSVHCEASVKNYFPKSSLDSNESDGNTVLFSKSNSGMGYPSGILDLNIYLQEVSKFEDGCATMQAHVSNISNELWHSSVCQTLPDSLEMFCNDDLIQILTRKTAIGDNEIVMTPQFWCLTLLMVASILAFTLANSLTDVTAFGLLGNEPENYGVQKCWSPVGWGIASMICGIMIDELNKGKAEKDFTSSFYAMLCIMTLDALVASFIRVPIAEKSLSIKQDMKALFQKPKVITFAVWCFTNGFLFSFIWNFVLWFVEDLASAGGSESKDWIKTLDGLVLTTQCFAGEVPFTLFTGKIMKKIGSTNCMTLVLFAFGLRFLLYSILTNPWWVLPIESLQGITYGLMYATMTMHASTISPPGAETVVQNIFTSLFEGAGTAAGGLVGGYLVRWLGFTRTFFILGVFSVVLGFLHMIIHKCLGRAEENISERDGVMYFSKEENSLNSEREALNEHSSDHKIDI